MVLPFVPYILLAELDTVTPKFCVRKYTDDCDAAHHASRMRFENEELPLGSNGSSIKSCMASPSSIVSSPQK